MNHPGSIIRLVNVKYSILINGEQLSVLNGVNLNINRGDTVAITGASGSGKTTLLSLMAGLERPTSGQIFLDGEDISQMDEDQRALRRAGQIGFIFQFFQLLPNLTALENVMLPLEINRMSNPRATALAMIEQVGLSERARHYPLQLSGGEQQRIAIARAFVTTPALLFADEPTGNLDKKTGLSIIDLLFQLNREHQSTLVIVTHDETLANRCQYHWPLVDGQLSC
ncbi:ABC transporter ATP-binding protein [Legionella sp. CNM-4043-24]|uniref:ABC transporter ATP-binding protein n=1 Tax=Legionella sp. CNM-4043-24 TaxID=3421646 RepID=UPI00403AC088